jgi:hypothetical protein
MMGVLELKPGSPGWLSLAIPALLQVQNPLGGRRGYDTAAISAKTSRPPALRVLLGLRRSSQLLLVARPAAGGRDCAALEMGLGFWDKGQNNALKQV